MNNIIRKNPNMASRTIKKVLSIDTAVLKTLHSTACDFKKSKSYGAIACKTNCDTKDKLKNILNPLDSADFIFEVPQKIYKILSMKVLHVNFPKRLYNVSEKMKNNYFTITKDGNAPIKIQIDTGSYTIQRLVSSINKQITNAAGITTTDDIAFDYDCKTNRVGILFKNSGVKINFGQNACSSSNFETTLGWMLGFRTEEIPIGCNFLEDNTVIAAEAIPEIEIPYIYIAVDDYNRNNNDVYSTTVNRESNILAKIPLTTTIQECTECCEDDNGVCTSDITSRVDIPISKVNETFFDIMNREREYFSPIDLEKLKIQFLDRFERVMDFGDNTAECVIEFECLYS